MTVTSGSIVIRGRVTGLAEGIAIFLTVAAARMYYVSTYSSSVPVWDQWDGEWASVILPWLRNTFTPAALWAPHNEHRIVLTKLTALLLFLLNGTWDPGVEMFASALLCGALAVWLCVVVGRMLPDTPRLPLIACVLLYSALPFGWGNTLGGFQSVFYYLVGCSLVGIWGLTTGRAMSPRSVVGLAFLLAAVGTLGSGFIAAASVTIILGYRLIRGHDESRSAKSLIQLALCGAIAVAGWQMRVPGTSPLTQCLQAPAACIASLGQHLAWPIPEVPWLAVLVYLPSALILWSFVAGDASHLKSFLAAVIIWVLVQAAAMVIGRPPTDEVPSRYMDVLGVGVVANFVAILLMREEGPRRWKEALALAWTVIIMMGLARVTAHNFLVDLPERRVATQIQEVDTRKLVRTGDKSIISGRPWQQLAYPSHDRLWAYLTLPETPGALPVSVRRAESFTVERESGFPQDGAHGWVPRETGTVIWGSYSAEPSSADENEQTREARRRAHIGEFHSGEFTPSLPYLSFGLVGDLRERGLRLVVEQEGRTIRVPAPPQTSISWRQWQFVDVRVQPGKPARIHAVDASPTGWFAFSGPFAQGSLSHLAARFTAHTISLLGIGIGVLIWLYLPRHDYFT